jgi:GTP-binding protein
MRRAQVEFVGSYRDTFPATELPEVAFAGRSNVGKSSALNCLLRRKNIARVSRTPGRTQLVNLFKIGDVASFVDLPGYGYAKVPDAVRASWKPMIERYLADRATLKLVVLLIDARRDPLELDGALIYALIESRIPSLVVATKADKLGKQQLHRQVAALREGFRLPAGQPIPFSSVTGAGREAVWDVIEAACGYVNPEPQPEAGAEG